MRAAIQFWDGEGVDQHEMFDQVDSRGSVSALDEDEDGLTLVRNIVKFPEIVVDDLPF